MVMADVIIQVCRCWTWSASRGEVYSLATNTPSMSAIRSHQATYTTRG